jgi:hypothetical protein
VLPISALPQVDYPTIQVVTLCPGASPTSPSSITAPLERQFGRCRIEADVVDQLRRRFGHHLQFDLNLSLDTPSRKCRRRSTRPAASSPPTFRRAANKVIRPTRRS